ncbi:hypothetical protein Tco_0377922, partial [Tanacetum coccineum]
VMSTPALFDLEIISQTVRAQSSRVPTLLPDGPYVAVREAHLVVRILNIESKPEEAPSETEEFEASEPSDTRITSLHSSASLDYIAPLSPDHPLTQTSPTPTPTRVSFHHRTARMAVRTQSTLSPGMSARIEEAAALSPSSFRKRYRSFYETPSPSSSLTLPIRKRYQGTSELVEDTEDESLDSVLAEDTAMDDPLGLGYGALKRRELVVGEGEMPNPKDGRVYTNIPTYVPPAAPIQTPPSPEWSSGSFPVSPSSPVVPTLVASPVTTPAATIAVDEDEFLGVGAHLELHGSILHDHTQRLDALPPILFEGYDRDLRDLYTRSGAARNEIFSQRYRFRSLELEQERATVTFSVIWRPVLALEAWAGQTDAQRAALWHTIYDIQRENHDLRMQIAKDRRERLELTDRVARMEKRQESRGE